MSKRPYRRISKERKKKGAVLRRVLDQAYSVSPRKATIGQPTKYRPGFCELATRHCMLGATNEELGELFGVTKETVQDWMRTKKEFKQAVYEGREGADARVAESMYRRAKGMTLPDVHVHVSKDGDVTKVPLTRHLAPDVTAGKFWLNNRRATKERNEGNAWADRIEHTGGGGGPIDMTVNFVKGAGAKPK